MEGKSVEKKGSGKQGAQKRTMILAIVCVVCVCALGVSLLQTWRLTREYNVAIEEYDTLRTLYAPQASAQSAPEQVFVQQSLSEINPDYIGWIEIAGTGISYPVVQGADNDKYLKTTFEGESNSSGAIFLDYRTSKDFTSPHTIIYGHNMKNGTMFGGLTAYLEEGYLAANSLLTITTADGCAMEYQIFAAKVVDMYDPVYTVDFAGEEDFAAFALGLGAPQGASRVLTLSTCTGGERTQRVVVHAVPVA